MVVLTAVLFSLTISGTALADSWWDALLGVSGSISIDNITTTTSTIPSTTTTTTEKGEGTTQKTVEQVFLEGFLSKYNSPLPVEPILLFKLLHPDFDIAGYLTVAWCESSLGTTGGSARYNNPGNIKWGGWRKPGDPKVWYLWMNGYWYCRGQGTYGTYSSMKWGQQANIRLLYDVGYNEMLSEHNWIGFANHYFGRGVPGKNSYIRNLRAAHSIVVNAAAEYGLNW